MERKGPYPYETRIQAVKEYISGKSSDYTIARETGISRRQIRTWVSKYRAMGEEGLRETHTNKKYTAAEKRAAVEDYKTGKYSIEAVCRKHGIRSNSPLNKWIKKYNSHEELKGSRTGGTIVTKGRKTTFDERVEIVRACIEQESNYSVIAEAYRVSYQQVRNWTVKYEQSGIEALQDLRGRRKPEDELSEIEKLKADYRILEAKNRRQALEIEFLKKLKELEGGGA